MRMRIGLALLFIVTCAGSAGAQTGSALDRLTRREETLGWEAVGRLDVGDTGFCTGTLVATSC